MSTGSTKTAFDRAAEELNTPCRRYGVETQARWGTDYVETLLFILARANATKTSVCAF